MELGLLYYGARFYVPGIGRFASADTIVPNPANPQSYNRYSYVHNNPLNLTDPTGHCAERGSSQEADACWYYLDNMFCYELDCGSEGWQKWIEVSTTSTWVLSELLEIHDPLTGVKIALANIGIDWLDTHVNGVKFERIHADDTTGNGNPALYDTIFHEIRLGNNAFNGRTVLHELGHAIDTYSPLVDLHDQYARQSGACTFVFCGETGDGYYFRVSGLEQNEAWADAFSVFVYTEANGTTPTSWTAIDETLISSLNMDVSQVLTYMNDATRDILTNYFGTNP